MIVADQNGVFSRILTDFGEKHTVVDKNGEDVEPVMIRSIEPVTATVKVEGQPDKEVQRAKINLPQDKTHQFEDGDKVTLSEIIGMEQATTEAPAPKGKKNKKGKQQ